MGKFLIPGLLDVHVHAYDARQLALFVANGVTTVRQMWGMRIHHEWQRRAASLDFIAPRQIIGGAIIDGPRPVWLGAVPVKSTAQARQAVRSALDAGAGFIKVYSLLSRDAYFAIVEEARARGVRVAGHVPYSVSLTEASRAGQHTVEHPGGMLLAASREDDRFRRALTNALLAEHPPCDDRLGVWRDSCAFSDLRQGRGSSLASRTVTMTLLAHPPACVAASRSRRSSRRSPRSSSRSRRSLP